MKKSSTCFDSIIALGYYQIKNVLIIAIGYLDNFLNTLLTFFTQSSKFCLDNLQNKKGWCN